MSADDAIFRDNKKFRAGSLSNHEVLEFWRQEILQEGDVNEAARILSWLENGVKIEDFLKKNSEGNFRGVKYASKYPTPNVFRNFVEEKHVNWVHDEVQRLLTFGAMKKWADCAGISHLPEIVAPLQVETEKTKNRLIYNARYLNCFLDPPPFTMDGVGKISDIGWEGMYMFSIDHKNGYFFIVRYTKIRGNISALSEIKCILYMLFCALVGPQPLLFIQH